MSGRGIDPPDLARSEGVRLWKFPDRLIEDCDQHQGNGASPLDYRGRGITAVEQDLDFLFSTLVERLSSIQESLDHDPSSEREPESSQQTFLLICMVKVAVDKQPEDFLRCVCANAPRVVDHFEGVGVTGPMQ
jgi:hypothetical protein